MPHQSRYTLVTFILFVMKYIFIPYKIFHINAQCISRDVTITSTVVARIYSNIRNYILETERFVDGGSLVATVSLI